MVNRYFTSTEHNKQFYSIIFWKCNVTNFPINHNVCLSVRQSVQKLICQKILNVRILGKCHLLIILRKCRLLLILLKTPSPLLPSHPLSFQIWSPLDVDRPCFCVVVYEVQVNLCQIVFFMCFFPNSQQ